MGVCEEREKEEVKRRGGEIGKNNNRVHKPTFRWIGGVTNA